MPKTNHRTTLDRNGGQLSNWIEVLFLIAFVTHVRSPGFAPSVLDWDEGLYAVIARDLLHGHLPYVDNFEIKPPGVFVAIASAMAIFGTGIFTVRMLGLLAVCVTCILLRTTALSLGLSRFAALSGAIMYGSLSTVWGGLGTNIEILFAPFTVGTALLAVRSSSISSYPNQLRVAASMGCLAGMAIWFKYVGALANYALAGQLFLFWLVRGTRPAQFFAIGALFAAASIAPIVLTAIFYALIGHWTEFWHANFGFMRHYIAIPGIDGPIILGNVLPDDIKYFLLLASPVFILVFLGFARAFRNPVMLCATVIWLLFEGVAVAAPGKYFDHYFLMLLPPLGILVAFGVDLMVPKLQASRTGRVCAWMLVLWLCLPYVVNAYIKSNAATRDAPRDIAATIRSSNNIVHAARPALWVVNSEPVIYLLAGAELPGLYPMPLHLLSSYSAIIPGNADAEIARLIASRPTFLVVDPTRWKGVLPGRKAPIEAMLEANYRLVAAFPHIENNLLLYQSRD